jgi:hypothetical protein
MVTHSSTSRPVQCLCLAERTGCPVFTDLWSYVLTQFQFWYMNTTSNYLAPLALLATWIRSPESTRIAKRSEDEYEPWNTIPADR